MKIIATEKLYKQLLPTQAAAMAFEAAVRNDAAELALIVKSQPLIEYRTPSVDYFYRSIGLLEMSLFYGLLYWRETACLMRAGYQYDDNKATQAGAMLGSLDAALVQVCDNLNVDINSVRKRAMVTGDGSEYLEFADADMTAQYLEMLTKLAQ